MRCDCPSLCPACEILVCEKFFIWVSTHMDEYNKTVMEYAERFPDRYNLKEVLVAANTKKPPQKKYIVLLPDNSSKVISEDEMNKNLKDLIGARIFDTGPEYQVVLKLERKK